MQTKLIILKKQDIAILSITKNGNAFIDICTDDYISHVLIKRDNFNAILSGAELNGAVVEQQLPDKNGNLGAIMKIFKTLKF